MGTGFGKGQGSPRFFKNRDQLLNRFYMEKNIILTGFMGAGKTSVGAWLSRLSGRELIDTDHEIEEYEGMSIPDIFAAKGEAAFRDMETAELRRLLGREGPFILSCGGGVPLRGENRKLLASLGVVYYLVVTPETVMRRLKGDVSRPLLQGEDALTRIRSLMDERKAYYKGAANVSVDADFGSSKSTAKQILRIHESIEK